MDHGVRVMHVSEGVQSSHDHNQTISSHSTQLPAAEPPAESAPHSGPVTVSHGYNSSGHHSNTLTNGLLESSLPRQTSTPGK